MNGIKIIIYCINHFPIKVLGPFLERLKIIKPSKKILFNRISRIIKMIENLSIKKSAPDTIVISIELKGESTPITTTINLKNVLANNYLNISEIKFSREWLNLLVQNFAYEIIDKVGAARDGDNILIPLNIVNYIKKIFD